MSLLLGRHAVASQVNLRRLIAVIDLDADKPRSDNGLQVAHFVVVMDNRPLILEERSLIAHVGEERPVDREVVDADNFGNRQSSPVGADIGRVALKRFGTMRGDDVPVPLQVELAEAVENLGVGNFDPAVALELPASDYAVKVPRDKGIGRQLECHVLAELDDGWLHVHANCRAV